MYQKIARMRYLIRLYYNMQPNVSRLSVEDMLKEIGELEKETGCVMADSPLYPHDTALPSVPGKISHPDWPLPMRRLGSYENAAAFIGDRSCLLLPLIDGIPFKLEYEAGELLRVSTFAGPQGSVMDCPIRGIHGIPVKLPYKERLVIAGIMYTKHDEYFKMCEIVSEKRMAGAKDISDMAADIIGYFGKCHLLYFDPFSILEGLKEPFPHRYGRGKCLDRLQRYGFGHCMKVLYHEKADAQSVKMAVGKLLASVRSNGIQVLGAAILYDDRDYADECGNDGVYRLDAGTILGYM